MTVAEFVSGLRERGVRLWVEGDRLRCSAPTGVITAEARDGIAGRKDEILALLRCAESLQGGPRAIVPLRAEGRRPPLFAVPGHNGDVFCYVALARQLEADQPLLGVQPPGLDGSEPLRSVEQLASYEVDQIRRYRPRGPYLLAGYCAGGTIAFEIARQLAAQGQRVALLALIGSPFPTTYRYSRQIAMLPGFLHRRARFHLGVLGSGSLTDGLDYVLSKVRRTRPDVGLPDGEPARRLTESRRTLERATIDAIRRYRLRRYAGSIDVFFPSESWRKSGGRPDLWRGAADTTREHVGHDNCPADGMLLEPHVRAVAAALTSRLRETAGDDDG